MPRKEPRTRRTSTRSSNAREAGAGRSQGGSAGPARPRHALSHDEKPPHAHQVDILGEPYPYTARPVTAERANGAQAQRTSALPADDLLDPEDVRRRSRHDPSPDDFDVFEHAYDLD